MRFIEYQYESKLSTEIRSTHVIKILACHTSDIFLYFSRPFDVVSSGLLFDVFNISLFLNFAFSSDKDDENNKIINITRSYIMPSTPEFVP